MARNKGGKAAASATTSTSPPAAAASGNDTEAPPPPAMSRTSTTDSQTEARAISSIQAVSDGGGQFVDSAPLDASRSRDGEGTGGGGEGSTLPPPAGEGSRTGSVVAGVDFGSLKHRIAGAIDHAVHPKDGSAT